MPYNKQIRATLAGVDSGPYTIYHTSIDAGNILATGITRLQLLSGYTVSIPDGATLVIVQSTGTCTNSASVSVSPISPTPTPTPTTTPSATPVPTPTPTPTSTPEPSPTPEPPTLTLSYIKGANFVVASLNTTLGADILLSSVFADGYTSGSGGVPVASIQDTTPRIIIPAGSTSYSFTPSMRCGGSGTTCWNTATHYTMYNIIINGISVSHGQTINIGGTNVIISFAPLRPLTA